jgi:hypothetical protein
MSKDLALMLLLAAGAVGLFTFLSVAAWVGSRAQERKARDRFALLKALAETPRENAQLVTDLLREQDARETARRELEERRGYLVGGLVCLAVGVALAVMIASFAAKGAGAWTLGLIPGLIGLVLVGFGVFMGPRR